MPQETTSHTYFVPLASIMEHHEGNLAMAMKTDDLRNCVVTMPVIMDVGTAGDGGKAGAQSFFVGVAVTCDYASPEALSDEFARNAPAGHIPIFAWIPANRFGNDDFGIFIDPNDCGETLVNGMVGEIIDQAQIEMTVTQLAETMAR
ncbi:hypothetical protein [Candidatus Puniceispirillum sp.]|uniref:hypothetical protein n=1 Tax=Candidatus Puniceispirillum sp. TaxID=2026719 RepID=UPI003F6A4FC8